MKVINKKNLDEWLFEYFEGNLSAKGQDTLHQFMEANPECLEEFDLWKETFISEPTPANLPVEKLLKRETAFPQHFKYICFPIVFIALLFSIGIMDSPKQSMKINKEQEAKKRVKKIKTTVDPKIDLAVFKSKSIGLPFKKAAFEHQLVKLKKPKPTFISDTDMNRQDARSEPIVDSVQPVRTPPKESTDIATVKKTISKKEARAKKKELKKNERRTKRTIRKMKRKAQQRREQEQFLKGHEPYVVPVDLRNF
ncbi:hypothetical protein RCC89_04165 [Cytophagaceae bacterium ABcell3]|nr:hypothetical protein RCC89_04165 [Cytophagaceae bacterium ABcell3]